MSDERVLTRRKFLEGVGTMTLGFLTTSCGVKNSELNQTTFSETRPQITVPDVAAGMFPEDMSERDRLTMIYSKTFKAFEDYLNMPPDLSILMPRVMFVSDMEMATVVQNSLRENGFKETELPSLEMIADTQVQHITGDGSTLYHSLNLQTWSRIANTDDERYRMTAFGALYDLYKAQSQVMSVDGYLLYENEQPHISVSKHRGLGVIGRDQEDQLKVFSAFSNGTAASLAEKVSQNMGMHTRPLLKSLTDLKTAVEIVQSRLRISDQNLIKFTKLNNPPEFFKFLTDRILLLYGNVDGIDGKKVWSIIENIKLNRTGIELAKIDLDIVIPQLEQVPFPQRDTVNAT